MDFSIQYVMMRTSYVMTRPSYVMMKTSLGEVLLRDFLSVLQVTQQHRQRVEISNATGRNVGMAQAVNLFFYRKVTLGHLRYYCEVFILTQFCFKITLPRGHNVKFE